MRIDPKLRRRIVSVAVVVAILVAILAIAVFGFAGGHCTRC